MSETAQITEAEIEQYKKLFAEKIGHFSLVFDKDEEGQEILPQIYQGDSGTDASWAGHVILESDNSVRWEFSILNGVYIEAKMKLTNDNKNIISSIYDFYEIWKNKLPQDLVSNSEGEMSDIGAEDSGEEIVSGGPAETSPAGEEMPLGESKSERKQKAKLVIINENSERMRRLAGLD